MSDPATILDALTPIDARGASTAERHRATRLVGSNRDAEHFEAHVAVNVEAQQAKNGRRTLTGLGPILTLEQQQRFASAITRKFARKLLKRSDRPMTPSALKQFATAWGIASDKLTILQGRPTQIIRHEEAETQRPAILELAERLARIANSVEQERTGNAALALPPVPSTDKSV